MKQPGLQSHKRHKNIYLLEENKSLIFRKLRARRTMEALSSITLAASGRGIACDRRSNWMFSFLRRVRAAFFDFSLASGEGVCAETPSSIGASKVVDPLFPLMLPLAMLLTLATASPGVTICRSNVVPWFSEPCKVKQLPYDAD